MKVYIQNIKEIIMNQFTQSIDVEKDPSKILIKIENFSDIEVYYEICKIFKEICIHSNVNFIAKLSKERYEMESENSFIIKDMLLNNWIEKTETLTRWRNIDTQNKTLILLMGSELIQDKGGLHDFYVINPEVIDNKIGDEYYKILDRDSFRSHICGKNDIVNNFFKIFFRYVPKNIYKLSKILDDIESNNIDNICSLDDLFNIFCSRLYLDWGIPNLCLDKKSLSAINSCKKILVLEKLFKFKDRKDFESLTKSKLTKLESIIENYKFEDSIPLKTFDSGHEFKEALLAYIKGNKLKEIKKRLFTEDFLLINNILEIKLPSEVKKSIKKITKIKGDPIFLFIKSILIFLNELKESEIEINNSKILIEVKEVILKENISDDDSLLNSWKNISRYLGGLLDYIDKSNCFSIKNGSKLSFEYFKGDTFPNKEFFHQENYKKFYDEKTIKKLGDDSRYSKIKFILKNDYLEKEFEYLFLNSDMWVQSFTYIDKYIVNNKSNYNIPLFLAKNLGKLSFINDEEEFANQFESLEIEYSKNLLSEPILKRSNYSNNFSLMAESFNEILNEIDLNGFYFLIGSKESNKIIKFITHYCEIAELLREKENDKQIINYFINLFFILDNIENFNEIGTLKNALSLSLHPAMLEKTLDKNRFILKGINEFFQNLNSFTDPKFSKKEYESLIRRLQNLSTITSSVDVLPKSSNGEYIKLISSFGMYSYYKNITLSNKEKIITFSNLNSKDILINEDIDDIDFSEETIFSKVFYKTIKDYVNLFKYSIDNLNLLFINPYSLQHIVAGIEAFINDKDINNFIDSDLNIKLTIIMQSYNITGENYLSNWVNEIVRDSGVKIEIYFTNFLEEYELRREIDNTIKSNEYDMVFIGNILEEKNIVFDEGENYYDSLYDIKFPTLYKPVVSHTKVRKIEISQPQFKASTLHSQLCYKISNDIQNGQYDNKILYKEFEFNSDRREILEKIHSKAKWVICIDKGIDKLLLKQLSNPNKVISFTSGEGEFGDFNVTISTTSFSLDEIKKKIKIKLKDLFSFNNNLDLLADKVIEYSNKIDGISLIKAANLEDKQIHLYLTDLLVHNYFETNNKNSILINLDNYKHWFITGNRYPDYLQLILEKDENNNYKVLASIIECKLGKENYQEIKSAEEQLIEGYSQLNENFTQNKDKVQMKYWNLQLYKVLIYSLIDKLTSDDNYKEFYNILQGKYSIEWSSQILYFITNDSFDNIDIEKIETDIDIIVKKIPKNIILETLLGEKYLDDYSIEVIESKIENIKTPTKEDNIISIKTEEYTFKDDNKTNNLIYVAEESSLADIISNNDLADDVDSEKEYAKKQLIKLLENLRTRGLDVNQYEKGYQIGPNFIRLKIVPEGKTSVNNIKTKYDDIKIWLSLSETPYIFADAGYISIDIPRKKSSTIYLGNIINQYKEKFVPNNDKLEFMIGVDEEYNPIIIDMQDANNPHMLIAGQSGSGKSVLLNCIITNIMMNYSPDDVKMILIDPKSVEMRLYRQSPFLLKDVITNIDGAIETLQYLTKEMDNRYNKFLEFNTSNLKSFNKKSPNRLHKIFVVFDEFGDYMAQDKKAAAEIERNIIRITQKGRAAGIHMIISTQSPKADIITTTIKNNLPSRVALSVTDMTASQVILDANGAENLYGKGDLLFKSPEFKTPKRLRSPYMNEDSQEELLDIIKQKYEVKI